MEPSHRRIIHLDMDAFYASVEQRDFPELKGQPVAVGGKGVRGVIAAASYEARKYGVRSAMPTSTALRKCPHLMIQHPRFEVYKEVSNAIRKLMTDVTPLVEPLSLDEAYLDVTDQCPGWDDAIQVALKLKSAILEKTQLTCTTGVSINKFVAKIASGKNKPNGVTVILPGQVQHFMDELPVDQFHGVGRVTAEKMHALGITHGRDLKALSEVELVKHFGKVGRYFYKVVRGRDDRPVDPEHERKSLSVERTFERDLNTSDEIMDALKHLLDELNDRYARSGDAARTIMVKIRFDDFTTMTRQKTFDLILTEPEFMLRTCHELLGQFPNPLRPVRLLGVGLAGFEGPEKQLTLSF